MQAPTGVLVRETDDVGVQRIAKYGLVAFALTAPRALPR